MARDRRHSSATHARRQVAIDGRDVLVTQVRHQFRLMTGKDVPRSRVGRRNPCKLIIPPISKNVLMTQLDLNVEQQDLINRVSVLARENFAQRAAEYDRTATFPPKTSTICFAPVCSRRWCRKNTAATGLGPYTGDVFTLWMMTKEIARADLSLARCWEGHVNSLVLLDGMATEEQKTRWFKGVVERGEKWVAWSGEPQARKPDEQFVLARRVEKVRRWLHHRRQQSVCDKRGRCAVGHTARQHCRTRRCASRGRGHSIQY